VTVRADRSITTARGGGPAWPELAASWQTTVVAPATTPCTLSRIAFGG